MLILSGLVIKEHVLDIVILDIQIAFVESPLSKMDPGYSQVVTRSFSVADIV